MSNIQINTTNETKFTKGWVLAAETTSTVQKKGKKKKLAAKTKQKTESTKSEAAPKCPLTA